MWMRSDAFRLIEELQPKLMAAGWFIALAGGVLNKGYSEHDLDLVAVPMKTYNTKLHLLHSTLEDSGLCRRTTWEMMRKAWQNKNNYDGKYVEVYYTADGKRVDIIIAYPEAE